MHPDRERVYLEMMLGAWRPGQDDTMRVAAFGGGGGGSSSSSSGGGSGAYYMREEVIFGPSLGKTIDLRAAYSACIHDAIEAGIVKELQTWAKDAFDRRLLLLC